MKRFSFWICCCSIVKILLPVVKVQNGCCIQDDVKNVDIFHAIFSEKILLSIFLLFKLILSKNLTLMEKLFLKIQNGGII
jgi:hypothetical protein